MPPEWPRSFRIARKATSECIRPAPAGLLVRAMPVHPGKNRMKLIQLVAGSAVLAGAIAAATAAQPTARLNPLRVSMVAAAADAGGFLGMVDITITNTSRHTVRVPRWQLPSEDMEAKLFNVSHNGQPVAYEGMMAKHGVPGASDFAILRAGQSLRTTVDLSSYYDLSKTGQYTVTYVAPLQFASLSDGSMLKQRNGLPMTAQSAPLQLWVDGSDQLAKSNQPLAPTGPVTTAVATAFERCTTTQQSQLNIALDSARAYSENAKGYLAGSTGPRYTTWFGAYTSSRYATASQHFVAIDDALDNKPITINCGCKKTYYAYVYPTQPYRIYVCRAFWSAPNTGTDSRAGTLIHETSHFNAVAGTDDHVYGQSGAKSLAISNPDAALDNADSHEYFAENTPFQN